MKGIITDLDNVLWGGILVEDGKSSLDHSGIHGQYRRQLITLANEGVLIAVSSKNNEKEVLDLLCELDLCEKAYPICANWDLKSKSIENILDTWNISPSDVVFIDDSLFELAEVKTHFPEMTCLHFDNDSDFGFALLMDNLRGFFPKHPPTEEDRLRLRSIVAGVEFDRERESTDEESFYKGLDAVVTINSDCRDNLRLFELANKTNQFHNNGKRFTCDEWSEMMKFSDLVWGISYKDKFGSLGTIGVLIGDFFVENHCPQIQVKLFCLSCRSLERRIEYSLMKFLCSTSQTTWLTFDFEKTEKNELFQKFMDKNFEEVLTYAEVKYE